LQKKYFHYRLVLIAQYKISVLATPVMSSNLHNQVPLFTELRLLQGTLPSRYSIVSKCQLGGSVFTFSLPEEGGSSLPFPHQLHRCSRHLSQDIRCKKAVATEPLMDL